jgi:hypothetical protein
MRTMPPLMKNAVIKMIGQRKEMEKGICRLDKFVDNRSSRFYEPKKISTRN